MYILIETHVLRIMDRGLLLSAKVARTWRRISSMEVFTSMSSPVQFLNKMHGGEQGKQGCPLDCTL